MKGENASDNITNTQKKFQYTKYIAGAKKK